MSTGQRLSSIRNKYKMTQEQLAQAIGLPTEAVIQWERGVNRPTYRDVEKVAKFFGLSLHELLPQAS